MALYTLRSDDDIARMLNAPKYNPNSQTIYNALGRNDGSNQQNDNFFVQRGRSLENAFGTTAAAIASPFINESHTVKTNELRNKAIEDRDKIAQKYGYNTIDELYTALDNAEKTGDTATFNKLSEAEKEDRATASANTNAMKAQTDSYKDYLDNNYVSKKINQDRGKFAGSAIKTLSTGVDVMLPAAGVATNAIQGGIEGVADELEQNGLENFDWGRAGQNAAIGATTGAVTGALNKGINARLAKNGGNVLKGGNAVTKALNNFNANTKLGRVASTIGTGAARGALSGAVGGAVGAGMSSAMNGVELGQGVQNALEGGIKGATSGAITGGTMAGINMAASKLPVINQINKAQQDWQQSGNNFDERLTNTLTSGDSAVGDWLMNKRQSKVLGSLGKIGNRIQDVNTQIMGELEQNPNFQKLDTVDKAMLKTSIMDGVGTIDKPKLDNARTMTAEQLSDNLESMKRWVYSGSLSDDQNANMAKYYDEYKTTPTTTSKYVGVDTLGNRTEYTPAQLAKLINEYDNYKQPSTLSSNSFDEVSEVAGPAGSELMNIYKTMNGGVPVDPYSRESWGEFENWLNTQRSNTPTTAKGWLKQAGKRIVEDLNNKGVGLSIKDVSKDMPEDIRNMQIRDYNANANGESSLTYDEALSRGLAQGLSGPELGDVLAPYSNLPAKVTGQELYNLAQSDPQLKMAVSYVASQLADGGETPSYSNVADNYWNEIRSQYAQAQNYVGPGDYFDDVDTYEMPSPRGGAQTKISAQTAQVDPWDRIAQQAGYADYDEAVQRYMDANPNVELNKNGAAGQILTWLDENPNTPTTAKGWAKQAGKRAIESLNKRGVGLSIQDTSEEGSQTQMYDALTGNKNATAEQEPVVVPSKTSKEAKMRNAQGKELLAQYGTVDAPMARATNAAKTFQELYDMGFEKPADVEAISNAITGSNGYVSTLNKNIIKSAKPVDTFAGASDTQTIDDFIDNSIEHNMLSGTNQGVAVKRSIDAYLRALPSRAEGSIDYTDSASDTFKVVQSLEARAAELEGRGGSTYHRATTEDLHQAAVLKDVAGLLKNRIYDGADVKTAITPKVVNEMKALSPDNEKWSQRVDNFAAMAKTPQDLRAFQAPFVKAARYIDNQYVQAATVGGRMAQNAGELPTTLRTTKAGIINDLVNRAWNSNAAHRGRAKIYERLADRAANNNGTPTASATPTGTTTTNSQSVSNPMSTRIYDMIGRDSALRASEGVQASDYINDVQNDLDAESSYMAPKGATTSSYGNTLEGLVTPTSNASTSVYDSITGTSSVPSFGSTEEERQVYFFRPTGDEWSDMLSRAMRKARNAGDEDAVAELFDMYQDAREKATAATTSASQTKLTDKQRQANAAARALADFENSEPNFAYDVSDIPVIGGIANLGGNDYRSKAEALALQIGYMLSGATVNKDEAQKIGMAYVPQPRDNETVRRNKLAQLRGIISDYQQTYSE